jgi:hypothetical protein
MQIRGSRSPSERGASLVELAFLLPILVVLVYGVVEFGRLIHARLVITNVSREGGSLASREIRTGQSLVGMLQASAAPFDLKNAYGRVWVTRIKAGTSAAQKDPYIFSRDQGGLLNASSSITGSVGAKPGGLSPAIYDHLKFDTQQNMADIEEVTVVEVFYLHRPITPLPNFVVSSILPAGGLQIGSRAVF